MSRRHRMWCTGWCPMCGGWGSGARKPTGVSGPAVRQVRRWVRVSGRVTVVACCGGATPRRSSRLPRVVSSRSAGGSPAMWWCGATGWWRIAAEPGCRSRTRCCAHTRRPEQGGSVHDGGPGSTRRPDEWDAPDLGSAADRGRGSRGRWAATLVTDTQRGSGVPSGRSVPTAAADADLASRRSGLYQGRLRLFSGGFGGWARAWVTAWSIQESSSFSLVRRAAGTMTMPRMGRPVKSISVAPRAFASS